MTSTFVLRGRHGTGDWAGSDGAWGALVAREAAALLRGRRGTW